MDSFETTIEKIKQKQKLTYEDWIAITSVNPIIAIDNMAKKLNITPLKAANRWKSIINKYYQLEISRFETAVEKIKQNQKLNKEDWEAIVSLDPKIAINNMSKQLNISPSDAAYVWTSLITRLYEVSEKNNK